MDERNASLGRRQPAQEGGLLIRTACEAAGTPGRGLLIRRVGGTGGVINPTLQLPAYKEKYVGPVGPWLGGVGPGTLGLE